MKKRITLQSLAKGIEQLSEKMDTGFDSMRVRFAEHDARFDSVDRRLESIQYELHQVGEVVLKDHEHRIHKLEMGSK